MIQDFTSDEALDKLERDTFWYFLKLANPANGLAPDNTRQESPASIPAIGLALAAYTVGSEIWVYGQGWAALCVRHL